MNQVPCWGPRKSGIKYNIQWHGQPGDQICAPLEKAIMTIEITNVGIQFQCKYLLGFKYLCRTPSHLMNNRAWLRWELSAKQQDNGGRRLTSNVVSSKLAGPSLRQSKQGYDQGNLKSQTHNEIHKCQDSTVSTLRIFRLLDLYPPHSFWESRNRSFVYWLFLSSG